MTVSQSQRGAGSLSPLVTIRDLKLRFPVRNAAIMPWQKPQVVRAVDGVDFDVHSDEIFGLAGESGCGKSTIARVLMGLIKPTEGTVSFLGRPISDYPPHDLRPRMQMVFQDLHLAQSAPHRWQHCRRSARRPWPHDRP